MRQRLPATCTNSLLFSIILYSNHVIAADSCRSHRHQIFNVIVVAYYIILLVSQQHKLRKEYRDLVICNSCCYNAVSYWSASLLIDLYTFSKYPRCEAENIEIILSRIMRNTTSILIELEELKLNLVMINLRLGNWYYF